MTQSTPPPGGTGREESEAGTSGHQNATDQSATDQRTTDQSATDQRTTDQRTTDQRTTDQGATDYGYGDEPSPAPADRSPFGLQGEAGDRGPQGPGHQPHPLGTLESAGPAGPADLSAPGIRTEHVSRAFGAVQAVHDLSFEAPRGAVTALVGPNGCGKSTLMLMLASLLAPDTGRVQIDGIDPAKDSPAVRRRVGWMPDQFGAWDSLRVAEVLDVMAHAYFLPPGQVRTRVDDLLRLMDLYPLAQQPAHVLSRGQKQRLGLARALVHSPQVLILDEPASGLDPASRRRLLRVVRQVAADGATVLVSSHILSELEEMADHVVFMDAGRVVDASSVRALASRPRPWRIGSLDHEALILALRRLGVRHPGVADPATTSSGHAEVTVQLPDEATAARLLADLAAEKAGVVTFGPATGRLEAAYLSSAAAHREGAL